MNYKNPSKLLCCKNLFLSRQFKIFIRSNCLMIPFFWNGQSKITNLRSNNQLDIKFLLTFVSSLSIQSVFKQKRNFKRKKQKKIIFINSLCIFSYRKWFIEWWHHTQIVHPRNFSYLWSFEITRCDGCVWL